MSVKKITANNPDGYIVNAESEGFTYTLDLAERGVDKELQGTTPTGLLLNALAGCILMTARSYFKRNNIEATELTTNITGDFNYADGAWGLEATAAVQTDAKLDPENKEKLITFIDRFCTVSGVLSVGNTININIDHQ